MDTARENIDAKNNKMQQNNEWASRVISGFWQGTGRWEEDKQWNGHGIWNGGLLKGNWNGVGVWESEDNKMGHWKGKGDLICNMAFQNYTPILLILLFSSIATIGLVTAISITKFIKEIGIITILLLTIILLALRKTNRGIWEATGTWQDVGDFRILKLQGKWKLGYHKGNFFGEMKDRKLDSDTSSMK